RAWRISAQLPAPAARGATIGELGLSLDVVEYDQGDVPVQLSPAPARSAWHEEVCDGLQRLLAEHGYRRVDGALLSAAVPGPGGSRSAVVLGEWLPDLDLGLRQPQETHVDGPHHGVPGDALQRLLREALPHGPAHPEAKPEDVDDDQQDRRHPERVGDRRGVGSEDPGRDDQDEDQQRSQQLADVEPGIDEVSDEPAYGPAVAGRQVGLVARLERLPHPAARLHPELPLVLGQRLAVAG